MMVAGLAGRLLTPLLLASSRCRLGVPILAADPGGPLLFLVDDQQGMRSAIERYLSSHGFNCKSFSSAEDALQTMVHTERLPDALVTDVLMPDGMDGLGLLRTVRSDARLCAVPVVLLTAKGLTPDRIAGYDAGCSAYLSKPFDPEELVAVIRSLTANALLSRAALINGEVASLRSEVASVKDLLQAMLQLQLQAGNAATGTSAVAPGAAQIDQGAEELLERAGLAIDDSGAVTGAAATGGATASSTAGGGAPAVSPAVAAALGAPALDEVDMPSLTKRETSVLELVGEGMLNKEIAARLDIGLRYVEKVSTPHTHTVSLSLADALPTHAPRPG